MKTYNGYKYKITGNKGKYEAYVFLMAPYLQGESIGTFPTKAHAEIVAKNKIKDWG